MFSPIRLLVLALQIFWIIYYIQRLPKDIEDFHYPEDKRDRIVLLVFWAITLYCVFSVVRWFWRVFY